MLALVMHSGGRLDHRYPFQLPCEEQRVTQAVPAPVVSKEAAPLSDPVLKNVILDQRLISGFAYFGR